MDVDVVVIGAGAAGLAAARCLGRSGLRAAVLEARHRIGGRVLSQPAVRSALPAELGAEFIHGRAPEAMSLLRDAGIAAIDTTGESWRYVRGALVRDDDDEGFHAEVDLFERSRALPEDESVERYLQRFAGDASMHETLEGARSFVEGFDAADPAIASVKAIADEWGSGVDSTSARPLGGYPPLFERLRADCVEAGVTITLATVVQRIAWRRGAVTLDARGPSGEPLSVDARAAVVTLPVGVLRAAAGEAGAVAFDPPLPPEKERALRSLEMGQAVKVVVWFRTPFWTEVAGGRYRDAAFFRGSGEPFGAYWTQYPVRGESVSAWAGGPRGAALGGCTESELIARARDGFGALFGDVALARREFAGAAAHNWAGDPFARGAYSYVAVGGGAARDVLGAPLGETVFFAGEATSSDGQGGTVNGALSTGERAAREATAALAAQRV